MGAPPYGAQNTIHARTRRVPDISVPITGRSHHDGRSTYGRQRGFSGDSDQALLIETDSQGNIYTTEAWEGKRLQKFVYQGMGSIRRGSDPGVLWPAR